MDKDHLRRAPGPQRPAKVRNDRLDRISRDVEELRRKRRLEREEQDQIINRLIEELEELKHRALEDIDGDRAEKIFRGGMYYKRIGKVASAEFFFGKILSRWPTSSWAIKASRERRTDLRPTDGSTARFFDFEPTGFY